MVLVFLVGVAFVERQDKTGQDKTGQDKTGQDKARHGTARQGKEAYKALYCLVLMCLSDL